MSALDRSLISILLIDSHAIVRASLRLLLDSTPGFRIVGEAGHIAHAIVLARREQPDIILFEATSEVTDSGEQRVPTNNGARREAANAAAAESAFAVGADTSASVLPHPLTDSEAAPTPLFSFISTSAHRAGTSADAIDFIPALFEVAPDAQLIVLTGSDDVQLHRRVVAQGAKGLLKKDCSPEVLVRAIECVYGGEVWIERTMMASVLAEIAQTGTSVPAAGPRPAALTKREREVIYLLCEGLPNRQIALRLCISETTVRRHLTTIFSKLQVADRLELVIYAYRNGLAVEVD